MLYPVAGSRIFIADLPDQHPGAVPAAAWVEIGEAEAFGMLGGSFEIEDVGHIASLDGFGIPVAEPMKVMLQRSSMQLVLGNDPTDPGQIILWRAWRSAPSWPFRILFPDGATCRSWSALVTGLHEVFDVANSVMKLQADLLPASEILRSEVP